MSDDSTIHRHASQALGAFVLIAIAIFLAALFQAGRVHEWFNPGLNVRVLVPSAGLFGLKEGATAEILGTPAGEVRRIVIDPSEQILAHVYIRESMAGFVKRDSQIFIRKRFGIAGDAYLEITRGEGPPLDEDFAVLEAKVERAPTETVGELISELRERVLPVIDDTGQAISALAELSQELRDPRGDLRQLLASLSAVAHRVERGEGSIGRLVVESDLVENLESVTRQLNATLQGVEPVLDELRAAASSVALISEALGEQAQHVPGTSLRSRSVLADLRRTTPELPRIARDLSKATGNAPLLLLQTQQTIAELEQLIRQIRSLWLLGGRSGDEQAPAGPRIPPLEVTP